MKVINFLLVLSLVSLVTAQNNGVATLPVVDGDSVCSAGENCAANAGDCPCPNTFIADGVCTGTVCVGCGDGSCGATEDCINCPQDCACVPVCGDGECRHGVENCGNCAVDCACTVVFGETFVCQNNICVDKCGDGTCSGNEDCDNCEADCGCLEGLTTCVAGSCVGCGDHTCSSTETCASCPIDCGCEFFQVCNTALTTPVCQNSTCITDGFCSSFEGCHSCPTDCPCVDITFNAPMTCDNDTVAIGDCVPNCNTTTCGDWMAACVTVNSIADCLALVGKVVQVDSTTQVVTTQKVLPSCGTDTLCLNERTVATDIADASCLNITSANNVWLTQVQGTVTQISFVQNDNFTAAQMAANFAAIEREHPGCSDLIEGLASQTFSGTFESVNNTAEFFSCCIRSDVLYCQYDQIGLIQADLFDNYTRAVGRFWEGGNETFYTVPCREGNVEMFLQTKTGDANIGGQVRIQYACIETPLVLVNTTYVRRAGAALGPTTVECAALKEGGTNVDGFSGKWNLTTVVTGSSADGPKGQTSEPFNLCVDTSDGDYTGSFQPNDGYERGTTKDDSAIGSGYYFTCDNIGTSLVFLLEDDRLGNFWWFASSNDTVNILDRNVPNLHGYYVYSRFVDDDGNPDSNPDDDDCSANESSADEDNLLACADEDDGSYNSPDDEDDNNDDEDDGNDDGDDDENDDGNDDGNDDDDGKAGKASLGSVVMASCVLAFVGLLIAF